MIQELHIRLNEEAEDGEEMERILTPIGFVPTQIEAEEFIMEDPRRYSYVVMPRIPRNVMIIRSNCDEF